MTLEALRAQQARRAALVRLALACGVTLAVVGLAACGPSDVDIARSGTSATTGPQVVAMSAVPAERLVTTTAPTTTAPTTTVAPTTTAAPVVTAAPTTTAAKVARVGECGGWADIVRAHFGSQAAKACDVIRCETGGTFDPTIENPHSTASGLMQFLDSTWRKARRMVGAEQYARASHAPGSVQIAAGAAWLRATSWSQWVCA